MYQNKNKYTMYIFLLVFVCLFSITYSDYEMFNKNLVLKSKENEFVKMKSKDIFEMKVYYSNGKNYMFKGLKFDSYPRSKISYIELLNNITDVYIKKYYTTENDIEDSYFDIILKLMSFICLILYIIGYKGNLIVICFLITYLMEYYMHGENMLHKFRINILKIK